MKFFVKEKSAALIFVAVVAVISLSLASLKPVQRMFLAADPPSNCRVTLEGVNDRLSSLADLLERVPAEEGGGIIEEMLALIKLLP